VSLSIGAARRCSTRCCIVATALVASVSGVASAQSEVAPATSIRVTPANARVQNYLNDLAGPSTAVRVIGGGLLTGLRDDKTVLGHEFASRMGQMAIETSVHHGLAAVMGHSTDYQPCECTGFGAKVQHALLETFTDRRADGTRAIAVPRMTGAYAGRFARLAWEQDGSGAQDVLVSTTLSFGFTAIFNVARELSGVGR
jgi:hypothetical protein